MHIGLIGGIGPAATTFYYEQLVKVFAERKQPLDLTIGNSSAIMLTENLAAGRANKQAQEFKRIADQLAAAGAECIVISSMGGHFCAKEFTTISPLPLISGPVAVREYLTGKGIRRPGILGTRKVMETNLYGELDDLDPVAPQGEDLLQVNDDYIAMAIAGSATGVQRDRLLSMGATLIEQQGAEVILLGGTDLNIVYSDSTNLPYIDTARVHVEAIVTAALDPTG